jgi:hypothetical protein
LTTTIALRWSFDNFLQPEEGGDQIPVMTDSTLELGDCFLLFLTFSQNTVLVVFNLGLILRFIDFVDCFFFLDDLQL